LTSEVFETFKSAARQTPLVFLAKIIKFRYEFLTRREENPMFKKSILLLFVLIGCSYAQDWQLVWSDEFDGSSVDESKWNFMTGTGNGGWGNNELEYYRKENATVADGFLTITAKKESYGGSQYTSSRMTTKNKGDFLYGRFEMCAKMPLGKGLWPAFWLFPTDEVYGGWAASGEVDMMEYLGHEHTTVHGTLHYGGKWPNNTSAGSSFTLNSGNFDQEFHIFAFEWENGKVRWYVDGKLFRQTSEWWSSGGPYPAPFDQRFYIILNLAVGGNWPGSPNSATMFPQQLVVDYIRVYQAPAEIEQNDDAPTGFQLKQNAPNPFNAQTRIEYFLPYPEKVTLNIYDVQGRRIAALMDAKQDGGEHAVIWDSTAMSSGIYLLSMRAGLFSDFARMIVLK
jgi:beta-glucanase (GH16 family)